MTKRSEITFGAVLTSVSLAAGAASAAPAFRAADIALPDWPALRLAPGERLYRVQSDEGTINELDEETGSIEGENDDDDREFDPERRRTIYSALPLEETITGRLAKDIEDGSEFCSWLPRQVQVSCLADRFAAIAGTLPAVGDYAPVRKALTDAANRLDNIAAANRAPDARRRTYTATTPDGDSIASGPLRPIAPDGVARANAAATQVIDEMQTVLLRSAENSRRRMVHYQEISAALDSSKVLLRSA